jgi:hypothetical protein
VQLVGPTQHTVEVPHGEQLIVRVTSGEYYLLTRYGKSPDEYLYTKGDPFNVHETTNQYSSITITLHKVVGGNYPSRLSSREEFERALAKGTFVEQQKPASQEEIMKHLNIAYREIEMNMKNEGWGNAKTLYEEVLKIDQNNTYALNNIAFIILSEHYNSENKKHHAKIAKGYLERSLNYCKEKTSKGNTAGIVIKARGMAVAIGTVTPPETSSSTKDVCRAVASNLEKAEWIIKYD